MARTETIDKDTVTRFGIYLIIKRNRAYAYVRAITANVTP